MLLAACLCVVFTSVYISGLDNGLGRTPLMGWLSWERYRCTVDCINYPDDCISEKLFKRMADELAKGGYIQAGYDYLMIDDCWQAATRDAKDRLQPDPKRFPSGIKALADYIHSKGLKFGIYSDIGFLSCAGYPGSEFHLEEDAKTFAEWTVDFLKLDGCYYDMDKYYLAYPEMGHFLNKTGRPIVYHCDWPCYQEYVQKNPDYIAIAKHCNTFRNCHDIDDSWGSLISIINCEGNDRTNFTKVVGPGNFYDADMLIIGNYGLSYDQELLQMAIWCLMPSPLVMSVDLSNIRESSKEILLNKRAIEINQDKLGKPGKRILQQGNVQVWTRPLSQEGSFGFAFINTGTDTPLRYSIKLNALNFLKPEGYQVMEVFSGKVVGNFKPGDLFTVNINPTGVFFGKATPL